jgi:hypothetical protein
MCLWVNYKKKHMKKLFFFASLKSLKKGVGSGVRSGSTSQRYGSAQTCHGSPTLTATEKKNTSGWGYVCPRRGGRPHRGSRSSSRPAWSASALSDSSSTQKGLEVQKPPWPTCRNFGCLIQLYAAGTGTKEHDNRHFWKLTLSIFSSSFVKGVAENLGQSSQHF